MNKYQYHFYKWGFFVLLSVLLASGIFVGFKASQPIVTTPTSSLSNVQYDEIPIKLNKKQLNDLSAAYLSSFQAKKKSVAYNFKVGKKYAILSGRTKVLGANIDFALTMVPSVTSDGNIKLKAHEVDVGSLKLPAKIILKYAARNYKLPSWVSIKGDTALLELDKIKTENNVGFKAKQIDIKNDIYQFIIKVPETN